MRKLNLLALLLVFFCFNSCKNDNPFTNRIAVDLMEMLHDKVKVEQILVHDVTKNAGGDQQVLFDCKLYFIDDLYKNNGELAFKKGLEVQEIGNKFIYSGEEPNLKLVGFEFGESHVLNQSSKE